MVPGPALVQQLGEPPADQVRWADPEFTGRGRVGELDHAVRVEGDDRIGGAFDDGVVAGVLALAQHPLALGRDGHVQHLDQAVGVGLLTDRPHRDVVQEHPARARLERQQGPIQLMAEQAGRTELQGVTNRDIQAPYAGVRKQLPQHTAASRFGCATAGRRHPGVPGGDPSLAIQDDDAAVERVEDRGFWVRQRHRGLAAARQRFWR